MGAEVVTVACKLPAGLLLKIADVEWIEYEGTKIARESNIQTFRVNGNAAARRLESNGEPLGQTDAVAGGYGLTYNVPAEFWARWWSENQKYQPVVAGLIFAHSRPSMVQAEAKEKAEIKSGLEAIRPFAEGDNQSTRDPRTRGIMSAPKVT